MNKAIATAADYELLAAITNDPGKRANCQTLAVFHKGVARERRQELEAHIPDIPNGSEQLRESSSKDSSMSRTLPERRPSRLSRWHYGGLFLGYATLTALFIGFAAHWSSEPRETKPAPNVTTGIAPANQSRSLQPRD